MAWIRTIDYDASDAALRQEYDKAISRAGRVYNVVKVMSLRASHLRASMDLYVAVMHGPAELSRAQREMLAVVVSAANQCHY